MFVVFALTVDTKHYTMSWKRQKLREIHVKH